MRISARIGCFSQNIYELYLKNIKDSNIYFIIIIEYAYLKNTTTLSKTDFEHKK